MDALVLTRITVHPLKSGAGTDLDASDVEPFRLPPPARRRNPRNP